MQFARAAVLVNVALLAVAALGCRCMNPGDTGDARAAYALDNMAAVFTARVATLAEGDAGSYREYENATLVVGRVFKGTAFLQNISSGAASSLLELRTHTVTACCLCGFRVASVANYTTTDFLASVWGESAVTRTADGATVSLSSCSVTCALGSTYCDDTLASLEARSATGGGPTPPPPVLSAAPYVGRMLGASVATAVLVLILLALLGDVPWSAWGF